jgi:hypothetical protein
MPREIAALGFLINGWEPAQYVELNKLVLVVLYDEPRESRRLALRLCGYGAKIVPHGVQWGGPSQRRFCRDLTLVPCPGAKRSRIDINNGGLLDLAFQLEVRIQRAVRHRRLGPRRTFRLPKLWAAFHPSVTGRLVGSGPEFTQILQRFGFESQALLEKFRRELFGLALYPLDWVSEHLRSATTVFAELNEFPQVQVFRFRSLPESLIGYQGACAYDFFSKASGRSSSNFAA